jgi:hypothetical protein
MDNYIKTAFLMMKNYLVILQNSSLIMAFYVKKYKAHFSLFNLYVLHPVVYIKYLLFLSTTIIQEVYK